jgi:hypothetical protein
MLFVGKHQMYGVISKIPPRHTYYAYTENTLPNSFIQSNIILQEGTFNKKKITKKYKILNLLEFRDNKL